MNGTAAQCTAKSKLSGQRCKNRAVRGFAVCRMHGAGNVNQGAITGRPVTHGLYSLKHRQSLGDKVEEYLAIAAPESLASELALLRALLQDLLDKIPDGSQINYETRAAALTLVDYIGKTVERESKVRNSNALTAAEITLLLAALKGATEKYIDDPIKRAAFIDEIRAAIGIARPVAAERYQHSARG
jgi:hypothetical protein